MPSPWIFALLALAAFRVTRLIGWDDLTTGWRAWYGGMSDDEYRRWNHFLNKIIEKGRDPWDEVFDGPTGQIHGPPFSESRWYIAKLTRCPWCLGFWVSLVTAAGWWLVAGGTIARVPLVALALSATVGFLAKNLDP